jgi:hypothetical protein
VRGAKGSKGAQGGGGAGVVGRFSGLGASAARFCCAISLIAGSTFRTRYLARECRGTRLFVSV